MNHKLLDKKSYREITNIFTSVFTSSEGKKEGKLIGSLASELSLGIDDEENICIGTYLDKVLIGVIFLLVFILMRPFRPICSLLLQLVQNIKVRVLVSH